MVALGPVMISEVVVKTVVGTDVITVGAVLSEAVKDRDAVVSAVIGVTAEGTDFKIVTRALVETVLISEAVLAGIVVSEVVVEAMMVSEAVVIFEPEL